jgi:hypothetical protein
MVRHQAIGKDDNPDFIHALRRNSEEEPVILFMEEDFLPVYAPVESMKILASGLE